MIAARLRMAEVCCVHITRCRDDNAFRRPLFKYVTACRVMKTLLLLLGALAFAHATDLDKLSTDVDALSYVLNLKCLRECP